MNKLGSLIMLGALGGASWQAHAQSSVTLYGILDTGIEYVTHTASGNVVRMPSNTGELPSRWGLTGKEDLGGGYSTIFTLESGFNVNSGASGQGGRLFGRQAYVGVRGPFGTLAFGRQQLFTYQALVGTELLGPDIYGLGSFDAWIPNGRADNAVTYTGTYSGFTFGMGYSFGRDSTGTGNSPGQGTCAGSVPGNTVECRDMSVMLRYDAKHFALAASYEEQRGGTNAAANFFDGVTPVSLGSSGDKDSRALLSGFADVGPVRLGAGWVGRSVTINSPAVASVHSNLYFLGASYTVTPFFTLDGEGFRIINPQHNTRGTMTTLRATYLLSKRTAVYAQSAYLWNSAHASYSVSGGGSSAPAHGEGQWGAMLGLRHMF